MEELRLDRFLSAAAAVTRSEAGKLLRGDQVTVNGVVLRDGAAKVSEADQICLNGVPLFYQKYRYLMMNKPTGYVSAVEDPRDRPVTELLDPAYRRMGLFPAGRLDKDTEGLLLLTNDGTFCHQVISPKKGVRKRYLALTDGLPQPCHAEAFARGLVLGDGLHCLPATLTLLPPQEGLGRCIVTVEEGKYHQVKRMLAACGCPVRRLQRLSIGALALDPHLTPGAYRELTLQEREAVFLPPVTEM